MRAPEGHVGAVASEHIDEAVITTFMAGLVASTPRDMTRDALALATVVRDPWRAPALPLNRATFAETLRRVRLRLIEEA